MLAASLMEWYLQTRTNTSINYKTILPLGAVFLQRASFHALFPTLIHPRPISRRSIAQPASSSPLSTRRRRTFDHPHSRVISRTIVPSPGLRKYLTLEGLAKGKKRTRSFERDRVDDEQQPWMETEIGEQKDRDEYSRESAGRKEWRRSEEVVGQEQGWRPGSLETNFSEID